jgi:ribonuclease E
VHAQVPVDVATFLLNEKRADIHSIEARLKVNVVLIPNTNLETPNYKVERLRHDDLNQADALPASYNLVSAPVEEETKEPAAQEARPPRQQAAVQGVTPERPAPVSAQQARPEAPRPAERHPGFMDRIFGWFKGDSAPAKLQPAPAPHREQQMPQPERGDRDRGNRDRGNRDRFRGRNDRPDQRQGRGQDQRGERPQRQDRQDRNSRPERPPGEQRPPRGERPEGQNRAPGERPESREQRPQELGRPPAPHAGAPEPREGDHERKRRRRGGRDRGERGERHGNPPPAPRSEENHVAAGPAPAERPASVPDAERFIAQPIQAPAEREQVHEVVMAENPQPEYRPAPPTPVAAAVSPAPREPDPAEIERALKESGLELVQTRSGATVASAPEPEQKFVPAKRERRPPPADLDEPLVQVETGNEPPTPKV